MGQIEALSFSDNSSALSMYSKLEHERAEEADIVLVGASQQDAIKLAYTNYFSDASAFISFMDDAVRKLAGSAA